MAHWTSKDLEKKEAKVKPLNPIRLNRDPSEQLAESDIRKAFDKISIPAVWKGLADIGYYHIHSDAEKLIFGNGIQTFELTIKQKK